MARGGRRSGAPDKAYPNRTDLQVPGQNKPPTQPIQTPPSAQYGQSTKLAQAQKVIPLPAQAGVPGAPMQAPAGPQAPPGPPQAPPGPPQAPTGPMAGELGPLNGPTQRPGEPVTHGAALGPGAGTEALNPAPRGLTTAAAILNSAKITDPSLARLRDSLNAHLSNQGIP